MENDNTTQLFDEEMLQGILGNMTGNQTLNVSMSTNLTYMYSNPQLPEWVPTVYLAFLCIAIIVGIPGNLITALAYFILKNKTNSDWYIFFVAAFDLVSCLFRVSGYLLEFLDVWAEITNDAYCRFVGWISQTSVCMSFLILGFIAIDRYVKVCLYYSMNISVKQSRNICLVLTAVTFILGSPTLIMFGNTPRGICTVATHFRREALVKSYYCAMLLLFIIMMVAVIYCYLSIAWKIWKNGRTIGMLNRPEVKRTRSTSDSGRRNRSTDTKLKHSPDRPKRASLKNKTCPETLEIISIPKVTRLFVIPGPQTKVIIQPSTSSTVETSLEANRNCKDDSNNKPKILEDQWSRRQKRDHKVTGLLFLVTTVFIISWIPPCIAIFKAFFVGYKFPFSVTDYLTLIYAPNLYVINNFANPLIYLSLSSTYRRKVKLLLTFVSNFLSSCKPYCKINC